MPASTDINSQIALKEGWTWSETIHVLAIPGAVGVVYAIDGSRSLGKGATHWINPEGEPAMRPDFVGTLEGLAELLRELNEKRSPGWSWKYDVYRRKYVCYDYDELVTAFYSPPNRPGYCVGEAWLSVKETVDGSIEL